MPISDVAICIVNWNTGKMLSDCIDSIVQKTTGLDYEIVITDNGSTDNSIKLVESKHPECKIIHSSNNGFSAGNNICVKNSNSRYLLFLNPDTILQTNAIHGMFKFLESKPEYGAIGCMLVNPDSTIQYTCASDFSSPYKQLCFLLGLSRLAKWVPFLSSEELEYWTHKDSRNVKCLSGACIMMPQELFSKIGGFDERYFMYSEDQDLCYRIFKSGYHIYYLADQIIKHYGGASSNKQVTLFSSIMQKESKALFFRTHWGRFKEITYRLVIFYGSINRIFLLSLFMILTLLKNKKKILMSIRRFLFDAFWAIGVFSTQKLKLLQW